MIKFGRRDLFPVVMCATLASVKSSSAQNDASSPSTENEQNLDQEIEMMRKDVRSQKRQIIAANMNLTDQEAEKFWPVYDRYTKELMKINDAKYALIKEYAKDFSSMTDEHLDKSVKDWLGLDQSVTQLRVKYRPTFRNALSAKSTARFYQLDRRIGDLIDLQLASSLPLVQP